MVTLALAAAVAGNLARRLTRPLREAQEATRRIASGDLAVRVPEDEGDGAELAGLARSINAMAESLERSRGMERQFLLSVSHDLRTPLTSIRGFGEALAEGRAPDPAHAGSVITAEARRLERLVGDLLELAKLDARRFSLDIRATDVAEVVSDTVEGFRPAAERAGVALDVDLGARGGGGRGRGRGRPRPPGPDRGQPGGERPQVRRRPHLGGGGRRRRDVSPSTTTAPASPPTTWPTCSSPSTSRPGPPARQVGSGLGLAIVAELVAAMGGSVRAEPARAAAAPGWWSSPSRAGGETAAAGAGRPRAGRG